MTTATQKRAAASRKGWAVRKLMAKARETAAPTSHETSEKRPGKAA